MPGVCGVFVSSDPAGTTTTPWVRQSGLLPGSVATLLSVGLAPATRERAGRSVVGLFCRRRSSAADAVGDQTADDAQGLDLLGG